MAPAVTRLLLLTVIWVLLAPGLAAAGPLDGDATLKPSVLTVELQAAIDGGIDPLEEVDLIIHFDEEIRPSDLEFLELQDLAVHRTFHFLPLVHATGPAYALTELTANERITHIEHNEKLHWLMDESTSTINATKVWQTFIEDKLGREHSPITGEGITVVILDSGMDAGHPDLDYGEKTIMNLKSDSDGSYTESINTDTSSGHGTHCAGTVAGNGDASQGARKGVAPGARMIGLSTGEAVAILNAVGALEWVYDHSQPGNNPYNIRVVSNSWGSSAAYNHDNAINKAIRKLTYENNVLTVFAAGNAGGDGTTVQTNPYSLEPAAISVAALERDGSGVASFSSRGIAEDNFTWPDVGAPGVNIWATEARKTLISASQKSDTAERNDGYYMAISGTSMATPHVSGLAALIWQAAPSLRVSNVSDDFSGAQDIPDYYNNSVSKVHEVELISELTAKYLMPSNASDNGVPSNSSNGTNGHPHDFAQGYGMTMADEAVALALTLEELRAERPETTVLEALQVYKDIQVNNTTARPTNVVQTQWFGDWSKLNSASSPVVTKFDRYVWVPNATHTVILDFTYAPATTSNGYAVGSLGLNIDAGADGSVDWRSGTGYDNRGSKHYELPVSQIGGAGQVWAFQTDGTGVKVSRVIKDFFDYGEGNEFNELVIEYSVGVRFIMDVPENETISIPAYDEHAAWAVLEFGDPVLADGNGTTGMVEMATYWYDLNNATFEEEQQATPPSTFTVPLWVYALIAAVLAGVAVAVWRRSRPTEGSNASTRAGRKAMLSRRAEVEEAAELDEEEVDEAEPVDADDADESIEDDDEDGDA